MGKRAMMVWGVLWAVAFAVAPVLAAPVTDTGVTKCYDDAGNVITCPSAGQRFYGQDANYTINPPSYTKLDSNGNALAASAASWVMVRDNVTGLIWEVKKDKDGAQDYDNPHDADNTYTWYDPDDPLDLGSPSDHDTKDFLDALKDAWFGGFNDWRLPTIKELVYLVDCSIPSPGLTINTTYFPNTVSSDYWSSTTYANVTSNAWNVGFDDGGDGWGNKSYILYVRAVRGGQSPNTFVDNGNGTVTDTSTGLMWQQDTAGDGQGNYDRMTWEEALAYCESRTIGGHTDWRLPTIKELHSLVDYSRYNPAINTTYFPNTVSFDYWSSTTYAGNTYNAWYVYFYDGHDSWDSKSYNNYNYVRAVRGGESGSFDYYVEPLGKCGELTPCYSTIQGALNAAGDGAMIKVAKTTSPEGPVWGKTGTVTISGGWKEDFSAKDGMTSIYAPRVTGGGGVKVQPNVKIIPKP